MCGRRRVGDGTVACLCALERRVFLLSFLICRPAALACLALFSHHQHHVAGSPGEASIAASCSNSPWINPEFRRDDSLVHQIPLTLDPIRDSLAGRKPNATQRTTPTLFPAMSRFTVSWRATTKMAKAAEKRNQSNSGHEHLGWGYTNLRAMERIWIDRVGYREGRRMHGIFEWRPAPQPAAGRARDAGERETCALVGGSSSSLLDAAATWA